MGVELTTKDKLECAMYCLQNQTGCQSFSFDQQTGTCRLGYCVISWPNSTSSTVQLYQVQQPKCENTSGFQVYTSGNISACLWVSFEWKTFTEAVDDCAAMNATLISLKYAEKLEILRNNFSIYTFIGLDDLITEGTYVWHDDLTVIHSELIPQLFREGEPNNNNGEEDCVYYEPDTFALNDVICTTYSNYICEKLCFDY
ncbi:CD209 antigen-like protein A [Biomphalaria glabrata]|uniref:CD209 antigen-like protein A n=1 Tax=Biomphalaria glabrata TaxID=6526 RepID=A0A9W2ZB85_BIOGL|nr:CD209 antigen-like protein A [Biomphalaria glabrata]